MEWTEDEQAILERQEHMHEVMRKTLDFAQMWLSHVSHTYTPNELDPGLGERLTKMMWQVEMARRVFGCDFAGEAFTAICKWVEDIHPPGVFVHEVEGEQEVDDIVLAVSRMAYEREQHEKGAADGPDD